MDNERVWTVNGTPLSTVEGKNRIALWDFRLTGNEENLGYEWWIEGADLDMVKAAQRFVVGTVECFWNGGPGFSPVAHLLPEDKYGAYFVFQDVGGMCHAECKTPAECLEHELKIVSDTLRLLAEEISKYFPGVILHDAVVAVNPVSWKDQKAKK